MWILKQNTSYVHMYTFFFMFTKMYTSAFVHCTVLTQSCKDFTVEEGVATVSKTPCRSVLCVRFMEARAMWVSWYETMSLLQLFIFSTFVMTIFFIMKSKHLYCSGNSFELKLLHTHQNDNILIQTEQAGDRQWSSMSSIYNCLIFTTLLYRYLAVSPDSYKSWYVQGSGWYVCVTEKEEERYREKVTTVVYFLPSYLLIHPQSWPCGTDKTSSPEVSSIPPPRSLFSLALFFLFSALQRTLSRPPWSPLLLPSLFLSVSSSFLPRVALIFSQCCQPLPISPVNIVLCTCTPPV